MSCITFRRATLALLTGIGFGCGSTDPASAGPTGAATDPVGDALYAADLVSTHVTVIGDTLALAAAWVAGQVQAEDLLTLYYLDMDELGTTGDLSIDPGLGSEYAIAVYHKFSEITIARFENGAWIEQITLTSGVSAAGNSVVARVPLALLGGDDGRMRFKLRGLWWGGLGSGSYNLSDELTPAGQPAIQVR